MNLDLPQIGGECQDFTRWWNDIGQFLQPMGEMDGDFALEFSKRVARAMYEPLHTELEAAKERAASEATLAEDRMGELIAEIEAIVDDTATPLANKILTILKKYDESH